MAPGRENGLSKTQASLLDAFCARNYIRLPLTRQHKKSLFVSRFSSSRLFLHYFAKFKTKALLLPQKKAPHGCGVKAKREFSE